MKKKIFYLLALLLTSATAWAEVTYVYDSTNHTLTFSGEGEIDDVIQGWYYEDADPEEIEQVIINDGITGIGYGVFSGCSRLSSVTIGNSVTFIGDHAFAGCWSLSSVTIPNSVTSIGVYAFENCTGLSSVIIGSGVQTIGENAFGNCTGLSSVIIGSGVQTIGDNAFSSLDLDANCTAYVLPSSPPTLGENAVGSIQQFYVHGSEYRSAEGWSELQDYSTIISAVTFGEGITASGSPVVSVGNTKYYTCDVGELTLSGGTYYIVFKDEDGSDVTADLLDGSKLYLPVYDITATIAPTHTATFAQGSGTEDGWTIDGSAGGATPYEGKTVTVAYSSPHKVKSVTVKAKE